MTNKWETGIPTKDGLYVIQIHPFGSLHKKPIFCCYYIKNGNLNDYLEQEIIDEESFWKDYAIKWKKINY